jgi:hypothetical protein
MNNINDFNKYINDLVSEFNVNHITTYYDNNNEGLEARIFVMDDNDSFKYRVVVYDADNEQTITFRFFDTYSQCAEFAETFLGDGYIMEHPDFKSYAHKCADGSEYVMYYSNAWELVNLIRAENYSLYCDSQPWATNSGKDFESLEHIMTIVACSIIHNAMMDAFNNQQQEYGDDRVRVRKI